MYQILQKQPNAISQLIEHAQKLQAIDKQLKRYLEAELIPHCRVANFRNSCLVIETDNAAWATRLRFSIPALTKMLRLHGNLPGLANIKFYVQSPTPIISHKENKVDYKAVKSIGRPMPQEGTCDERLQAALNRVENHIKLGREKD